MSPVTTGTFEGLIRSLDADPLRRGKQFEKITKWWLQNDPIHSRDVKKVWLWDEWPDRPGRDIGVDLVAEMRDGSLCAIQSKCFDVGRDIPKSELDSFVSAASTRTFKHRWLVASTDGLSANARRMLRDNHVTQILFSYLDSLEGFWPASFDALGGTPTIVKASPRPHQQEAIRDVIEGLSKVSRGQLIMACGTGKTLTALWITEALEPSTTLVLVPSLSLLSQTLSEWAKNANTKWDYLCVCSDETVNKSDDAPISTTDDLPFDVTTKPADIAAFLERRGRKIIFSTYQSSAQVAKAQKAAGKKFDLVICDEAHRLTGKNDAEFATALDDTKIPARKRLFMTATPRTFTTSVKAKASERGVEITSMDDESIFGKELHKLSFGQAIEKELLTDYRVVIVGVTDPQVQELIDQRELVSVAGTVETDARTLAAHIGLAKATKDYDLKRTISFHGRIKTAQQFAQQHAAIVGWMPEDHKPSGTIWADTITGAMNSSERRKLLNKIKTDMPGQHALLSNARCLTEGIDVPSLDGVAFIDPRSSQVDIIQAVGRAIRKAENKKHGTIVLPVLIHLDDDSDRALEESDFKPIFGVLNALKSHDDNLELQLTELRTGLGRDGRCGDSIDKIVFDLPVDLSTQFPNFASSLLIKVIERTTSSWDFKFGLLQSYVIENGSALVRDDLVYKSENLGKWVGQARQDFKRNDLVPERVKKLEQLKDWSWTPYETFWHTCYQEVQTAVSEGDLDLSELKSSSASTEILEWIKRQRNLKNRGWLDEEKALLLEKLDGWTWDPLQQRFNAKLELLREFSAKYGTTKVSKFHPEPKFRVLASWAITVRMSRKNGTLEQRYVDALESVPHWNWDPFVDQWNELFELLETFVSREGHALPKANHFENGVALGSWVSTQRARQRRRILPDEQRLRLESLPKWSWDPIADLWETSFDLLKQYIAREGTALVPHGHIESNINLGSWVLIQRQFYKKDRMPKDRVSRLESLAGWDWSPQGSKTEANFQLLKQFIREHGNSDVMSVPGASPVLKRWVQSMRSKYASQLLNADSVRQLESVKGWQWEYTHEFIDQDQLCLNAFQKYFDKTGSSLVPSGTIVSDIDLFKWVQSLRTRKARNALRIEIQEQIEAFPNWDWNGNNHQWNQSFDNFTKYLNTASDYELKSGAIRDHQISTWISNQRASRKRGTLSRDRAERLESIPGWTWTPLDDHALWKINFQILKAFAIEHHTSKVSKKLNLEGVNIWNWINYQRMRFRKKELKDWQISLLENLPEWDWNPSKN
jgi:superfamily II DNA or RNA helicase